MTDVMDAFKHLDAMSQIQLFERRSALVGSAPNGDYRQLSDEVLQELVAIHRILRRHSGPKGASRSMRNEIPTPDQL
jgi:hypothetical protein